MIPHFCIHTLDRMVRHLETLYGPTQAVRYRSRLAAAIGRYGMGINTAQPATAWKPSDVILITYADMVQAPDLAPLHVLHRFLNQRLRGVINTVHILPFFPWSSDDGFSVMDYRSVAGQYGDWNDIKEMGRDFNLMFDLVLNHVSRQSKWFEDYRNGISPGRFYFIEVEADRDLSAVTRPRTSPLLTEVNTKFGQRYVWSTFSDDQIDLDFSQPDVLFEFLDVMLLYLSQGARILRLDAVAYLWKTIGTECIHLPQVHTIVKLLRDFIRMIAPDARLLTETNVPHGENISYFGDGDEAHMVYQFALPPLLLHAIHTQDATVLTGWAASLSPPPEGCTYLNFTASHDGIGVRPLQGLIDDQALRELATHIKERGGQVAYKSNADGTKSAYEYNISYYDAVSAKGHGHDHKTQRQRFLVSQAVMLAMQGVPAIYFHSLFGTHNDHQGVTETGIARRINRRKFTEPELRAQLDDPGSEMHRVFEAYMHLLRIRVAQPAFAPEAEQEILDVHPALFTVRRHHPGQEQTLVCMSHFSAHRMRLKPNALPDCLKQSSVWHDLLTDKECKPATAGLPFNAWQTRWLCPVGKRKV